MKKRTKKTYKKRMVGSPTNSPIGSYHWYITLLNYIGSVGEYMQSYKLTKEERIEWGKAIAEKAGHLMDNYDKIPY